MQKYYYKAVRNYFINKFINNNFILIFVLFFKKEKV